MLVSASSGGSVRVRRLVFIFSNHRSTLSATLSTLPAHAVSAELTKSYVESSTDVSSKGLPRIDRLVLTLAFNDVLPAEQESKEINHFLPTSLQFVPHP